MWKEWLRRLLGPDVVADPIDHPELRRLSPDALSDLPLWAPDLDDDQPVRPSTEISAVTEFAM